MKNFLKSGLVVVAFLTAFGASANEKDFSLKVKSEKGKTVSFSINEAKNISLAIYGKNNEILHEENIQSNGNVNRTYDLNAFPEGRYILEIDTDFRLAQYEIHIKNGVAIISEKAIHEIFKPVLKKENGLVRLMISNTDNSPVEVVIMDENRNELYTAVYTNKASFSKVFDTNFTPAERLTFVIKYNDQIFSETIASR